MPRRIYISTLRNCQEVLLLCDGSQQLATALAEDNPPHVYRRNSIHKERGPVYVGGPQNVHYRRIYM